MRERGNVEKQENRLDRRKEDEEGDDRKEEEREEGVKTEREEGEGGNNNRRRRAKVKYIRENVENGDNKMKNSKTNTNNK